VAHAFVLVEQGQLGPGVGTFAADDDAGAVRVSSEVDQAGQLGDLGPGTEGAVLFQRWVPEVFGKCANGSADLFGDGVSDRERGPDSALPQPSQVGQEGLGTARAVGADEDRGAVAVGVGDLGEGLVEDGDVVGGGVRAGVARSQETCQGLAGVVQEAQHRVVAEAAFVGGGGLFLLGVAGDQGGVDVQHQTRQFTSSGVRCGYRTSGCPPACSQATSRALARAARRAFRAAASMPASTRQAVGVEATEPNTSCWSRSTARSRIASPPSASITARSTATRPGSCPVPRGRSRCRASEKALVSVVASARSASRREPAWLTTP
jgi:hypothetical protein